MKKIFLNKLFLQNDLPSTGVLVSKSLYPGLCNGFYGKKSILTCSGTLHRKAGSSMTSFII